MVVSEVRFFCPSRIFHPPRYHIVFRTSFVVENRLPVVIAAMKISQEMCNGRGRENVRKKKIHHCDTHLNSKTSLSRCWMHVKLHASRCITITSAPSYYTSIFMGPGQITGELN